MTFKASTLQLTITSGNKTASPEITLPGGTRHTLGVKNNETGIEVKQVSLLNS